MSNNNIIETRLKAEFESFHGTAKFLLGEDANNPQFEVLKRSAKIISLFPAPPKNSPHISQPAIATLTKAPTDEYSTRYGMHITVNLPSTKGSKATTTTVAMYEQQYSIPYKFFMHLPGATKYSSEEEFQWWEYSDSKLHREIGEDSHGFVLVHSPRVTGERDQNRYANKRFDWETSDGKEILAVWGTTNNPKGIPRERNRPFTFRLYGSAAAGKLGDKFSVVALMSAIQIWEWIG